MMTNMTRALRRIASDTSRFTPDEPDSRILQNAAMLMDHFHELIERQKLALREKQVEIDGLMDQVRGLTRGTDQ